MEKNKIMAIDWENLKSGTSMYMKDFPSVKLIKLDNSKACYINYDGISIMVDIKEYSSESHGNYHYFRTCEEDWHPLTSRLWIINET